ncbi:uncharacterized protein [Rutidosis leptorrhynchoides]|uniref:uncharacterized protein n=1 Tax=Rutidosis leptorrhynchoides TaxID=125765 RepID=UPI003A99B736
MKILSLNIRGFGLGSKLDKSGWVKKLIATEKPTFVALQETKLNLVDFHWIQNLWGNTECEFVQKEKVGKSEGQLLIWDINSFKAVSVVDDDCIIGIKGLISKDDKAWLLCGDFNEVRNQSECFNCEFIEYRAKRFNDFIHNSRLIDITFCGRNFTRVCDEGLKYNKIDRFLVNDKFCNIWVDLTAMILDRHLSDHCPITLKDEERNFGPKPFKIFDTWLDEDGIEELVQEAWNVAVPNSDMKDCSEFERPSLEDLTYTTISTHEASDLESPFEEREIHDVILDCGSSKAPGPDGFNLRFFKKIWNILKDDLIDAVTWFWNKGEFSRGCNATFVTLIPKKNETSGPNDFHPISLIGSYYKIIAKVLSNCLRKTILSLVGPEQSAFMKGRFILDGAQIFNETIDYLKCNKQKGLLFKVDFENAFDCLNWEFLKEVMKCMGFGEKWRKWIYACLSSASISILVNGSPTNEFSLSRGVRQGDPLSPFLFIIAAEGLNILTKAAIERGLFKGVEVGVNFDNVNSIATHVGCQVGKFPFTYIGLPIGSKMKNLKDWDPVIEKFKNRLANWKMKTMSCGGRLVLIKLVLMSLPLYYFSIFRAPPCVLKALESVRRYFFWGGGSDSKIAWVKWDNVIASYGDGGLNIGSLKSKNLALLGKWWWRLKTETNALWVKIIRSIYGSCGGLEMISDVHHSSSTSTWSNIVLVGSSLDNLGIAFKSSFVRVVGENSIASFWNEHWIGNDKLSTSFPRLFRLENTKDVVIKDRVKKVDSGILATWDWSREPTGRTMTELQGLMELLSGFQFGDYKTDSWSWTLAHDNRFTVMRLAGLIDKYTLQIGSGIEETARNNLVPKRLEIFTWRELTYIRLDAHFATMMWNPDVFHFSLEQP